MACCGFASATAGMAAPATFATIAAATAATNRKHADPRARRLLAGAMLDKPAPDSLFRPGI
jgi:hypothetical protein